MKKPSKKRVIIYSAILLAVLCVWFFPKQMEHCSSTVDRFCSTQSCAGVFYDIERHIPDYTAKCAGIDLGTN